MIKSILEPERAIPIRREVDVLVCGGGVSGVVAALAAARQGASVALIESYGFLGGVNTAAQVNGVGGWQYDLDGEPLISGIPLEIMSRVTTMGGNVASVDKLSQSISKPNYSDGGMGCFWIRTNPEHTKYVLDQMMAEAGVYVLLHANITSPIMEGKKITGAFVESKSGREAIVAKVVIDCTGDGDVAARAGAEYIIGRPEDGACQPMTLIYTVGKSSPPKLWYGAPEDDPEVDPLIRNRFEGAIKLARERGEFNLNPNDIFCAATPLDDNDPNTLAVNFTRVQKKSSIDADDLTQAEIEGRQQVHEAINFMRKYMPGSEDAYLVSTAPQIGLRESRRISGDYLLTGDDVRNAAEFDDSIARGIYLLDIHNPTDFGKPSSLVLLDAPYSVPYRTLLPKGLEGLLVAGRCISGDHIALASYRVQSHAMAIGQAAGTAAALSAIKNINPRQLDVEELQIKLVNTGANLGVAFR